MVEKERSSARGGALLWKALGSLSVSLVEGKTAKKSDLHKNSFQDKALSKMRHQNSCLITAAVKLKEINLRFVLFFALFLYFTVSTWTSAYEGRIPISVTGLILVY